MSHKPIGQWLVEEGLLSEDRLQAALKRQSESDMPLGDILSHHGYVPRLVFYKTLAKQFNLPFVNLMEQYHAEALFDSTKIEDYLQRGYVPYKQEGNTVIYAITHAEMAKALLDGEHYVVTTPIDIFYIVQRYGSVELSYKATDYLRDAHSKHALTYRSARQDNIILLCWMVLSALIVLGVFHPQTAINVLLIVSNIIFSICISFKLALAVKGMSARQHIKTSTEQMTHKMLRDDLLPVYTVLVPLYKEEKAAEGIVHSLMRMDYPKEKLDIKLIVEADDALTYNALLAAQPEPQFHIVKVPPSTPQTKPKACNYALAFAKGELVAIYDAEDMPDEQQLRLAATCFHYADETIVALQARLNYYNADETMLTRWFSYEYRLLFTILLPAMYAWKIPIPLGGTSNHIKRSALQRYGAWDAYNVTEDADLGIRLASAAYVTLPIASDTMEEAPLKVRAWTAQRSRWIKGYLQSWFVMLRSTAEIRQSRGMLPLLGIHIFMGLSSLCYIVAPFLWLALMFSWGSWSWNGISLFCIANLIFGVCVQYLCLWIAERQRKSISLRSIFAMLTFPCYFILHSFAALKAVVQLFTKPYHWEKTMHGISRFAAARMRSNAQKP